ncbi:MAG: ABC-type Fe3+ transport system periplasmic component [Chloroflexi bacterium]|nr:ABC-type Fe3+ transport system periplasmic component [Chloroflexota bacterium]
MLAGVFESTFPRIKVQYLAMPNVQLIARMAAERSAGRYIPDVMVGPGSTAIPAFKPDGGLAPIKPSFVLPEVLDESLWLNGRHWWMDAAPPYVAMGFVGQLQPVLSYNTQLVDPKEITSYWDLLNPKWKGKVVARDVRQAGPGGPQVLYQYRHPDLGFAFVERFWTEMEPQISVDARQMIDWLAQGQYVIGFAVNSRELREAGLLGLPVALIPVSQLKEGSDLSHAGGSLNLSAQAPHPNAAKLYVNWLLSREGQIAWQKHTLSPSLRQDIPKDGLDPSVLPTSGVQYISSSSEDYGRLEDTPIEEIITRAVARNQR